MADNNDDILEQFKAFMQQKADEARAANDDEDEEIELWNEKGQGGRVRRSRAAEFARALGIDFILPDPEPTGDNSGDNSGDNAGKSTGKKSTGKTATNSTATGVAQRYFRPKVAGK